MTRSYDVELRDVFPYSGGRAAAPTRSAASVLKSHDKFPCSRMWFSITSGPAMDPSEVVPTTKLLDQTILGDTMSKGYTARRAAAKSARTCCRLVDEASVPRTQHHQTHLYIAATQGGITAMEHISDLVVLRARRFESSLCSTSLGRSLAARSGWPISSRWEQA